MIGGSDSKAAHVPDPTIDEADDVICPISPGPSLFVEYVRQMSIECTPDMDDIYMKVCRYTHANAEEEW